MSSILVLGAGELGISVLRALAGHSKRNGSLFVMMRSETLRAPSPSQKIIIDSFETLRIGLIPWDILEPLSDNDFIFSKFDVVIGCMGMGSPPGMQKMIAEAVLKAGVKKYIPWQFGVDYDAIGRGSAQDLFSEQLDVRDMLRAQTKTQWVIVSTGIFMDFLFGKAFGVVTDREYWEQPVVRALGAKDNKVTVTSVEDIGRVVAEIMYGASEVQGVIYTAGQTVSYEQLANAIRDVLMREIEIQEWSLGELKEELEEDPDNGMKKYRVVFAEGKGVWWDEDKTWNKEKGMKLKNVKEWVEEHSGRRSVK